MKAETYPSSYLYTMVTELLHEMGLGDRFKVSDVRTFGHDPDEGPRGSVWVEVFNFDGAKKVGTERISRWIEQDISFKDWGNGGIPCVVG